MGSADSLTVLARNGTERKHYVETFVINFSGRNFLATRASSYAKKPARASRAADARASSQYIKSFPKDFAAFVVVPLLG